MVFNSVQFAIFFVIVYAVYRVLPHRPQNWLLLGASYYFYAAWDWRFLGLLIGSTIVDFCCALVIDRESRPARRRAALIVSLGFNLGMLAFFKYFNFFAGSLRELLAAVGWQVDFVTINVLLPIGISFYTFMTISYVIDVYRREIAPTRNLLDFALFVAYFPHLVAGPILRASKLIPQIAGRRTITRTHIRDGLWLTAWGLFLKMFVADNLGRAADAVFAPGSTASGLDVLLGVYAFAFQIYGDFAGYSNIARGTSMLMGIELNINFLYPYFVTTPQAFWRHWHISLSTWLRDYLYIPLGGNRGTARQTRRNLFLTMVLGGLWHGAAWTFVLWGVYHGLVLIAYREATAFARRLGLSAGEGLNLRTVLLGVLMFHVTCAGWLIFRATSAGQVADLAWRLVTDFTPGPKTMATFVGPLLFYAGPFLLVHVYEARRDDLLAVFRLAPPVRYALYGVVLYFTLLFGDFGGTQFIYFQF